MGKGTKSVEANTLKASVQILFASERSIPISSLKDKLRELFVQEPRPELRGIASLTTIQLISILLEGSSILSKVGLSIKLENGVISLWAGPAISSGLHEYLVQKTKEIEHPVFTQSILEVLSCIAFKQPISQGEIDYYFDTEKRSQVQRLSELKMVECIAGQDGLNRWITSMDFNRRFGSPTELKALVA